MAVLSGEKMADSPSVLVLNSGSSSVKYKLFDMEDESVSASGLVERIGEAEGTAHHRDPPLWFPRYLPCLCRQRSRFHRLSHQRLPLYACHKTIIQM